MLKVAKRDIQMEICQVETLVLKMVDLLDTLRVELSDSCLE